MHRPVSYSRMRYNRVDVPQTYQKLIESEFTDDFTMGYTSEIGFRAGTCTPFYFYDICNEQELISSEGKPYFKRLKYPPDIETRIIKMESRIKALEKKVER